MRTLVICSALLIAAPLGAESLFRATISGVVMDTESYPLPAVTITITSRNLEITRTAVTDWYGRFEVKDLPVSDDWVVRAEQIGFHAAVKRRIKLASGDARELKLRMREVVPVELTPPPELGTFPITPEIERLPV